MSELDLPFHRLEAHKFEELAATVLEEKYQLPLLTFTSGRDRGRDAAARRVTVNIGGTVYTDHNVVVQVKHTKREGSKVDNSTCNRLFIKELDKVDRLVMNGQLDMYIIVLNYRLPAGQEEKIVHMFEKVGCKRVVVIGLETLNRWIKQSESLSSKISKLYSIGGVSTRRAAIYTAKNVQALKPIITNLKGSIDTVISAQTDNTDHVQHQIKQVKQHTKTVKTLVKQGSTEIKDQIHKLQKQVSDLDSRCRNPEPSSTKLEELNQKTDEIHHMLHSVKHHIQHDHENDTAPAKKCCVHSGGVDPIKRQISMNHVQYLMKQAGFLSQWKFVARSLGINESDIRDIEQCNKNLKEQAYNMLIYWQNESVNSDCDILVQLQKALISCRLNSLAVRLSAE